MKGSKNYPLCEQQVPHNFFVTIFAQPCIIKMWQVLSYSFLRKIRMSQSYDKTSKK